MRCPSTTAAVDSLEERFRSARRDPSLAVLEGFHVLKHALRFRAELALVVTSDPARLEGLAARLAPDVWPAVADRLTVASPEVFARLVPVPPPTGILALAARPRVDPAAVLAAPAPTRVVFLDEPSHLGNIGAAVRVAAAAGAAGVLVSGPHDPWHPAALRGAAGLQYAVPTASVESLAATDRPIVAVDPAGAAWPAGGLPARAVLAFGSERRGLSAAVADRAGLRVRIPMQPGVSSLNLATAVAVALYMAGP